MWRELLSAIALLLVIEGIMPFLNPNGFKQSLRMMLEMNDRQLRLIGVASMVAGVVLLSIVRG